MEPDIGPVHMELLTLKSQDKGEAWHSVCLISTQFSIPSVVEQTFGTLNDANTD